MTARTGKRTGWRNLRARNNFVPACASICAALFSGVAHPETARLQLGEITAFPPGIGSADYSDARLTISPDGRTALWFSRTRPGGPGGYDIWMSQRTAAAWSAPTLVSFNSPQREFDPVFSANGAFVYFCSDRPGGLGGDDIWRVAVSNKGFGEPEHLGDEVNSSGNEWAPMLSGANHLLFSSNGRKGARRMDLFLAHATADGRFSTATMLPGSINTEADDFDATFLADDRTIVFSRAPNLEVDTVWLYFASANGGEYDAGTRLPDSVNLADRGTYAPTLDGSQRNRFTFSRGGDLFVVSYHLD